MDLRAPLHGIGGFGGAGKLGGGASSTHQSILQNASPGGAPSPSVFDALLERLVYHQLCRMYAASRAMELGSESRFTGLVLFHRYVRNYYHTVHQKRRQPKDGTQISNDELNRMKRHLGPVAAACLFLGCKMEEEPRRIRDVLNLSHLLDFSAWEDDASLSKPADGGKLGEAQSIRQPVTIVEAAHPPPLDESYWKSKEQMVSTEQHVLRTIQFDTTVSHPHRCVLLVMETLGFGVGKSKANDNATNWLLSPDQSEGVILSAWRILNEAPLDPRGTVLEFPTVVMSCAAISLAAEDGIGCDGMECSEEKVVDLPEFWWRALDVETKDMTSAKDAMQIMLR